MFFVERVLMASIVGKVLKIGKLVEILYDMFKATNSELVECSQFVCGGIFGNKAINMLEHFTSFKKHGSNSKTIVPYKS